MPLASIPSPPGSDLSLGPLKLHIYGALIVAGVIAAVWLADRRWRARGGEQGTFSAVAMWAVPGGLIGARIYHVATDYELYTHHPIGALEIWQGGLGIWGGVAGGVLVGYWYIRRHGLDFGAMLDCAAPALPLAQAIGRWGNYFNQELFGRPSTLPWALKVDMAHRPQAYLNYATFQPTFLYESIWDLIVVALLLVIERRVRLRKGYLFAAYVSLYTFGRFFTEYLRIDFAHKFLGLRLNDWTSIIIFVVSTAILLGRGRRRGDEGAEEDDHARRPRVSVAAGQGGDPSGSTLATTDLHDEEARAATGDHSELEPSSELPEEAAGVTEAADPVGARGADAGQVESPPPPPQSAPGSAPATAEPVSAEATPAAPPGGDDPAPPAGG